MKKFLITEEQFKTLAIPYFKTRNEDLKKVNENWSKLDIEEKELVIELYKVLHPEQKNLINESFMDYVQTGLDFVGMVPYIGDFADIVNAVLYFKKGDVLFGMLSLVSLIPIVGDFTAGPLILAAKAGGKEIKYFKAAVATKNADKIADAAKALENSGSIGKKILKFLDGFTTGLGNKIMNLVRKAQKVPVVGKFFTLIEDWVKVFTKAASKIKVPTKIIGKGLSKTERVAWEKTVKKMLGSFKGKLGTTMFRDMAKNKAAVRIFGLNLWTAPASKVMLGKTKLFGRFLDKLGLGNFVGPEEVDKQVPNAQEKFAEFLNTPEGQQAFTEEFSETPMTTTSEPAVDSDILSMIASKLGIKNLTPEMGNVLTQILKNA